MALVRYQAAIAFPVEVLIPMRLLIYNGGGRKLILRGGEQTLPAPIASWLQTSVEHGRLIATVAPVAEPVAVPTPGDGAAADESLA